MGILFNFVRDFRQWDKPSQIGFFLALGLMVVMVLLALSGAENLRTPTLIGIVGLSIVLQAIVLWGNRHLVAPYTQAQRAFVSGDFERAKTILEGIYRRAEAQRTPVQIDTLVLLGNTYRQLGELDASLRVLRQAVTHDPEYPFALYGWGRSLLANGQFEEALTNIKKSLSLGAPPIVKFDVGHTYYRLQQATDAVQWLREVLPDLTETHRHWMATYILYRLGAGEIPPLSSRDDAQGFWQMEAQHFAHTPYGQALQHDIDNWQLLKQEA